jgi:hypothetical protein
MKKLSIIILHLFILSLIFIITGKISSQDLSNKNKRIDLGLIENDLIKEASGIAASRKNDDVIWIHNDSGGENRLFVMNSKGKHLGIFYLKGAKARDWEDIAVGPGPLEEHDYIYVADIGDNKAKRKTKYIYRIIEPDIIHEKIPIDTVLKDVERIAFQYPDGKRDAETIMVDPISRDIYIVSKRESDVRVYRAEYPQSTKKIITLEYICSLNMTNVTAGDISATGCEILLKTYDNVYYWNRLPGQKLWNILKKVPPKELFYISEPQGEAITWHPNSLGFYTTSEEKDSVEAHLYFYEY